MIIDTPANALAGFMLSMNTFVTLRQTRILSYEQANEILEMALLNLETHQALTDPSLQPIVHDARQMLEHLRDQIAPDRY